MDNGNNKWDIKWINCNVPLWIRIVYWIAQAIGKHVIADNALTSGCECVRIDEPAHLGVIVTTLEIIEVGLSVVDVAMMAKMADSRRLVGCRNNAAKRLIFASSDRMTIVNDDGHDIALEVCNAVKIALL